MTEIPMVRSRATRKFVRLVLCVGSILFGGLISPDAGAEASGVAPERELFRQGVASARSGDLEGALARFRAAYELKPNQTVLYNIAHTESALARPVEAIRSARAYLEAATREDV